MTSKRRRPLARYVRMTNGWGYLCPRCRDIIMFDRELQLYFCHNRDGCGFSESKEEYKHTLKDIRTTLDRGRAIQRASEAAHHAERLANAAAARAAEGGVVYYVRFRDAIKIGTSLDLPARLAALPWEEVLALEPGSYEVEERRHAQFAAHHLQGEWFAAAPELVAHADQLRTTRGDWATGRFGGGTLPWTRGAFFGRMNPKTKSAC